MTRPHGPATAASPVAAAEGAGGDRESRSDAQVVRREAAGWAGDASDQPPAGASTAGSGAGVLDKVMTVLEAFTPGDANGLAFAELQRRTGLAKTTLHRVAADMVRVRLLDRADGRYHLSRRLFELGMLASIERALLEVATPFLEDLYEHTHESVHLGVREGTDVVYVAKLSGHRQISAPSRPGGRMPAHATAIGKALVSGAPDDVQARVLAGPLRRLAPRTITSPAVLAHQLAEVASAGVAFEFEESRVGIACVAAPVVAGGEVVAAVSVAGPTDRFDPRRHVAAVRAAAAGVGATLDRRRRLLDDDA